MPVTPDEAHERRAASSQPTIDVLCQRIDDLLSKSAPNGLGQWWFNVADLPQAVRTSLLDTYRGKRWRVDIIYDGRDGDALVFEKP